MNLGRMARLALVAVATLFSVPGAWASSAQLLVRAKTSGLMQQLVSKYGLSVVSSTDKTLYLLQLPDGMPVDAILPALSLEKGILSAEVNSTLQLPSLSTLDQSTVSVLNQSMVSVLNALLDVTPVAYYGATVPNGYVQQPAMQIVNLAGAQQLSSGAGIIIALIDGGIDTQHPALQGSLMPGFNFLNNSPDVSAFSGLDQSTVSVLNQSTVSVLNQSTVSVLNQSTVSVLNQSTVSVLNSLPPYFGHGTSHAGVLHLVAPQSSLLPLRAFQDDGTGQIYDIVRALYYAVDQGASVISMSFSCDCRSQELDDAIRYAFQRGVILVAAVGNDNAPVRLFPAAYPSVLGVGATNLDDTRAAFSNTGSVVYVVAPGAGVITTYPGGHYAAVWGTSFSAPQVAAQAALLLAKGTLGLHLNQAISGSTSTAIAGAAQRDMNIGFGRIDLLRSLLYSGPQ